MPPFRGWSSWNALGINVNADDVLANAAALSRLCPSYRFVNIDDGFFFGRDDDGRLLVHPEKFPDGMRSCLDRIRHMGLRTGIYSDAGRNTCGFYHSGDAHGRGAGLEDHEHADIQMYLRDWGCDLLKVDWCGAWMRMNARKRYTEIGGIIRSVRPDALFSVCSWAWPGQWVTSVADSWRVGPDLQPTFSSVLDAVHKTKHLWKHASSRGFNDLDILQLGHGMGDREERTHFAMWCMLNSPLLLSFDLPSASPALIDLVNHPELLAIHDDPLGRQAVCTSEVDGVSVWKRRLNDGSVAVACMNETDQHRVASVHCDSPVDDAVDCWTSGQVPVRGRSFAVRLAPRDTAVYTIQEGFCRA